MLLYDNKDAEIRFREAGVMRLISFDLSVNSTGSSSDFIYPSAGKAWKLLTVSGYKNSGSYTLDTVELMITDFSNNAFLPYPTLINNINFAHNIADTRTELIGATTALNCTIYPSTFTTAGTYTICVSVFEYDE